ncbi:MAG TPA: serine/threonine-protein kinase [Anaerolineales bacterium]|nr:serine/threonine-protein kinase [Anaerolineales bacterium]
MENFQPGQMLGAYRIIGKIGQGGMATVYKAYQPSMDRHVAIKVLPGQLADSPEFVKRFQQEARIIARLEHPHILPVFDFGEDNGITFFVMRYFDAGTLKDKMAAGPLPIHEIDRIFTQLADALGYAHARGIVHRDLKPANALVDADGNLFLTDFGIAKLLESASPRLTQTDAIMGTPAYISPEQAQAGPVDQRSDIYSLGIILYEMVTGRVPYVADTPLAVILKHVSDPLPLPSVVKTDISPAIEQVILKALAKNPNDRFATTAEFVAAWKRALREMDTLARAPEVQTVVSPSTPPPPQIHRPPVSTTQTVTKSSAPATGLVIGCVAILCLALAAGGVFFFGARLLGRPSPEPPTQVLVPTAIPVEPTATQPESPTEAPVSTGNIILEDDFSDDSVWGVLTDSDSSIQYADEALQMIIHSDNYFIWTTPDSETYEDVHMEVTVLNNGTDSNTAFGFLCNQQSDGDSFYYLVVTPLGQYVIAKAAAGEDDIFLTNNDEWAVSDLVEEDASSYRVGADCGTDGTLTLYVDGQEIDSVVDDSYSSGGIGLMTWSGEGSSNANVSFDDFLVTDLP